MQRTWKYRLYPTGAQARERERQLMVACDLYNAALEQRIWAWRQHRVSINSASNPASSPGSPRPPLAGRDERLGRRARSRPRRARGCALRYAGGRLPRQAWWARGAGAKLWGPSVAPGSQRVRCGPQIETPDDADSWTIEIPTRPNNRNVDKT